MSRRKLGFLKRLGKIDVQENRDKGKESKRVVEIQGKGWNIPRGLLNMTLTLGEVGEQRMRLLIVVVFALLVVGIILIIEHGSAPGEVWQKAKMC